MATSDAAGANNNRVRMVTSNQHLPGPSIQHHPPATATAVISCSRTRQEQAMGGMQLGFRAQATQLLT